MIVVRRNTVLHVGQAGAVKAVTAALPPADMHPADAAATIHSRVHTRPGNNPGDNRRPAERSQLAN